MALGKRCYFFSCSCPCKLANGNQHENGIEQHLAIFYGFLYEANSNQQGDTIHILKSRTAFIYLLSRKEDLIDIFTKA